MKNEKSIQNLKPFKKGIDSRRNINGQPRKLPELQILLADALGKETNRKTAAMSILDALIKKATKGDVRAAEVLLNRSYGLPKQFIEHSIPGKIRVTISNE